MVTEIGRSPPDLVGFILDDNTDADAGFAHMLSRTE
jgi:hypothetical protein